ncbi:MAG: HTTM domain-containing protein [Minicystis sp.]
MSTSPNAPSPESKTASATDAGPDRAAAIADGLRHEDFSPRAWLRLLRDLYCTFDRRTLGFGRIMLGFLLAMDLIHRRAAWDDMYTTIGVLPTPLSLQRPQAWGAYSVFHAFCTPGELKVLWWVMFVNALCLLVGYRTKVAQILAVFFVAGMNGRILLIENGGYVVNNLLAMWTAFLPLGDRFSVDSMLASMKRRRETTAADLNDRSDMVAPGMDKLHVTALGAVLFIQLAAIYFFNVVHKTGPAWKNGTAVHYVLYVDRMATPFVALVRDYIPNFAILFMTKSALTFEATLPVVLLAPVARVWARRTAVFMINALHIAFGVTFVLGPFAWSCCVFSTMLFSSDDWELATRTMRRTRRARTVVFDPKSGGALLACRILKRLDRFELLTFQAEEGVPLGIGIRRPAKPGELVGRAAMLAEIVEALPLGPIVAWIPRLPVVSGILDSICATLEQRDLSRFFGLRVEGAPGAAPPAPEPAIETPGIRALPVTLGLVAVAAAVYVAVVVDKPMPGIALIVVVASLAALVNAWIHFPTLSFRVARRAVVGTVRELFILAMFTGAVLQAGTELWCINRRVKVPQPEPLRLLSHKMRYLQGWFMFSPNPVMDDGTIVVDAVTIDGRHIDPFTGKAPFFDLSAAQSLRLTQIWCDYFNRIQLPANTPYREAMKEYMYRLPQRTGNPNDTIVSGDVYWVKDMNPKWNETKSYGLERNKLFSFENPAAQPRASN